MPVFKNLAGQKFHRCLLIQPLDARANDGRVKWLVLCECGTFFTANGSHVTRGNTKSCGCWKREATGTRRRTHGLSQRREYKIFHGILKRCYNPNNKSYGRYGGRGIVCLWHSFEEFYEAMGKCPSADYMIERRDNNGPYSTENCVWATRITQANNTRRSRTFTYNGETLPLKQWAQRLGKKYGQLYQRLHEGWTVEEAFTTPFHGSLRRGKSTGKIATKKFRM